MAEKRNYNYIWIGAVILVFGAIFVPKIADRLGEGSVVERDRMSAEAGSETESDALEYITLNGERRKVPEFALTNQDSLLVTDADYLGKVWVAEFFFTTCPTICPQMTANLVELQDELAEYEDFGVASFTINPRHDTPAVLKDYAERYGITDMDWHLLTGPRDSIYELANAGFNIFAAEIPDVPGGFEHSGLFALIDREGYIRSRKDRFGNPLVYYRGTISRADGSNDTGETEQISLLKEDLLKLLKEENGK